MHKNILCPNYIYIYLKRWTKHFSIFIYFYNVEQFCDFSKPQLVQRPLKSQKPHALCL